MFKRISKITYKGDGVIVHVEETIDDSKSKSIVFKSIDKPHPDFLNALRNLESLVRHILALPEDWFKNQIGITQVSYSYSDKTEVKGAVITGIVNIHASESPFCFNTPHIPYEQYSDTAESPVMPSFGITLLDKFESEAAEYMNGKSAQLNLALAA